MLVPVPVFGTDNAADKIVTVTGTKVRYVNIKVVPSENPVGVGENLSLVWFHLHSRHLRDRLTRRALDCSLINECCNQ
jgi:hypothetical protein